MEIVVISMFFIGYLLITLEHVVKVDKVIPALLIGVLLWTVIAVFKLNVFEVNTELKELEVVGLNDTLLHHLGKVAEVFFFLVGAMTIIEVVDYFKGFEVVSSYIKARSLKKLLFIVSFLTFFISAAIDNLTTTIVMITILQKIIHDKKLRFWFAGLIVIAANAGGAWSPIGDVTTTMLWISNKVTSAELLRNTFIPSLICVIVPVFVASRLSVFKGSLQTETPLEKKKASKASQLMFYVGMVSIVSVPIFKAATGLPPYLGIILSLAVVFLFSEVLTNYKFNLSDLGNASKKSPIHHSMSKIEFSSIMFFFGILMAVTALESLGQLFHFAQYLSKVIPNQTVVVGLLGIASAIIDNVPLVAASIGMFSEPIDSPVWHLLAFSAGTGGSILVIGSAAGVVAMGMEKISFFEYLKKISLLAFLGFAAGYVYMIFTV